MEIKFCVERSINRSWVRVSSDLDSILIAENMKQFFAKKYHEDPDNFSILVYVV